MGRPGPWWYSFPKNVKKKKNETLEPKQESLSAEGYVPEVPMQRTLKNLVRPPESDQ